MKPANSLVRLPINSYTNCNPNNTGAHELSTASDYLLVSLKKTTTQKSFESTLIFTRIQHTIDNKLFSALIFYKTITVKVMMLERTSAEEINMRCMHPL